MRTLQPHLFEISFGFCVLSCAQLDTSTQVKDEPSVVALKEQVTTYTHVMKAHHILDYEVGFHKCIVAYLL